MKHERRNRTRHKLKGIKAGVSVQEIANAPKLIEADIIDISLSGIRIRLKQPLNAQTDDLLTISMTLPESGAPFTIKGSLKHQADNSECGLHYVEESSHVSVDDLLFECIKLSDETLLVKTI